MDTSSAWRKAAECLSCCTAARWQGLEVPLVPNSLLPSLGGKVLGMSKAAVADEEEAHWQRADERMFCPMDLLLHGIGRGSQLQG